MLTFSIKIYSQTVIEQLDSYDDNSANTSLADERIEKISLSKRVFILTNNQRSFDKGDFISLISESNQELICRALVAKTKDAEAGIKLLKIYNVDLWNSLKNGSSVKVLRGDDSYYKKKDDEVADSKIKDEDDLYNDTAILEDDLDLESNKKRVIKTDNLVSLAIGKIAGRNNDGSSQRYTQLNVFWAYQIQDNIYLEAGLGQSLINDYPNPGLDTKITNIAVRAKYTFLGPMFSYIQPYVGFQSIQADSPGAGAEGNNFTDVQRQAELDSVEALNKRGIIVGVTALKRLVPGWFFRLNLGTDLLSAGFSFEF